MDPVVTYPVHDLEGRLLVPAGTVLSMDYMENLCRGNTSEYTMIPLLQHGSVLKDLMRQFTIPPYDVIFSQEKASLNVLDILERVRLPLPILQALDHFRQYDFHTYRHMLIISALSTLILRKMDPDSVERQLAADSSHFGPSHDIGKLAVPVEILLKKSPLTRSEHDILKNHALAGYILLGYYQKDPYTLAALIARDHHERRDGTGYPAGIRQENVIVEVTTVCDIYDALVAQRPYRPVSFDNRTAIEELTIMAENGSIGWEALKVLVAYNRQEKPDPVRLKVSSARRGHIPEKNFYGKFADEAS